MRTHRITRLEAFAVSHPLSPHQRGAAGLETAYRHLFVKLTDDDGVTGWGETDLLPGIGAHLEAIAPLVLGQDPMSPRPILARLRTAWAQPFAVSALSIAIDDLRARRLGIPVAALHGGPVRSRVRAYAASYGYVEGMDPFESLIQECDGLVEQGFTAIKLRGGVHPVSVEIGLIERLRARLPRRVDLMVDANAGLTMPFAIELGRALHALGALWLEEPLPQEDYAGYPRLAAELDIALAGGELSISRGMALDLLGRASFDIIQPDPVICGGIGEALFIADLARVHGIHAVFHTPGGAIGTAAGLQATACLAEPTRSPASSEVLLEYSVGGNPWRTELVADPIVPVDGWVDVRSTPGLGVTVDEPYLRRRATATWST